MSEEEELRDLREKDRQYLLRARRVATRFGVIAVTILIALVYVFFGQTQANMAKNMAEYNASETKRLAESAASNLNTCIGEIEQVRKSLQVCKGK